MFNLDLTKLSALVVEWENSHNFSLESVDNCLHYGVGLVLP